MMNRMIDQDQEQEAHQCLARGIAMERIDDYATAVDWYERGLSAMPRSPYLAYFLNNNLGYSLNQLGRFTEAEPYCRRAIEIETRRHNAHKNLGVSLTGQKRYPEAATEFVSAARACPEDPRALRCLERLVRERPELESVAGLQAEVLECQRLEKRNQN